LRTYETFDKGGTHGGALQQAAELVNVASKRGGHNIYLLDGVKVTDDLLDFLVVRPRGG
jgi:hypothetical protein